MNELATRTESGELVSVNERQGRVSSKNIVLPRATVLHEAKDGLKAGTLINTITNEELKGTFIPLFVFQSYVKFVNFKAEWVSMDEFDPRVVEGLKWNNKATGNEKKPKVTEFLNFACVFNDDTSFPVIMGFKSTGLKVARKLNTVCGIQSGVMPIPGTGLKQFVNKHRYNVRVETIKGVKTHWVPSYEIPTDKSVFNVGEDMQKELSQLAVTTAKVILSLGNDSYAEAAEQEF